MSALRRTVCVTGASSGFGRNRALVIPGKKEVLGHWLSRFAQDILRRVM